MGKWVGIVVFSAAMLVSLILATVALGVAGLGGGGKDSNNCAAEEAPREEDNAPKSVTTLWPDRLALFGVASAAEECDTNVEGVRGKIVELARKEVGYAEKANNTVKYFDSSGLPWCSVFVSWVWKEAGVKIDNTPYTCDVGEWAKKYGKYKEGASDLKPGDAVVYSPCKHMGIVEKVHSNGKITTIEGNYGDAVTRRGPFDPKSAGIQFTASPVKD